MHTDYRLQTTDGKNGAVLFLNHYPSWEINVKWQKLFIVYLNSIVKIKENGKQDQPRKTTIHNVLKTQS